MSDAGDTCKEVVDRCFRGRRGAEAFDELGADYRAAAVAAGFGEGLLVGDAESYQAGMFQIHVVDTLEVLELLVVETVAGSCGGGC